jgi:uncharacterized damage-inducible protein DinB
VSQRALIELFRGKGAHVDPIACVEDISAELAARQVEGFSHSIAQLVFHMNYWMSYELRRIRGEKPTYPEHNSESFPLASAAGDEQEWNRVRRDFAWLLEEYAKLAESSRTELDRQIETVHEGDKKVAGTLEAVLWQMVAHNSYHVGQIAMIRRTVGAWPPRGGGDSW